MLDVIFQSLVCSPLSVRYHTIDSTAVIVVIYTSGVLTLVGEIPHYRKYRCYCSYLYVSTFMLAAMMASSKGGQGASRLLIRLTAPSQAASGVSP